MSTSSSRIPKSFLLFSLLLLVMWSCFVFGYYTQYQNLQHLKSKILLTSPLIFLLIIVIVWSVLKKHSGSLENVFQEFPRLIDHISPAKAGIWIALAAGLGLYTELAIIRIHSSYFQIFAFFKNFSLLSCFLGLGIGYAQGKTNRLLFPIALPLLTLQIFLLNFLKYSNIEEFLQNPVPDQVAFGLGAISSFGEIISVYGFLCFVFTLNTLCLIPLGQMAAYLMEKKPLLTSYGWNLIGSLAGIIIFAALSFANTPPIVWMLVLAVFMLLFVINSRRYLFLSLIFCAALVALLKQPNNSNEITKYSPYQVLTLKIVDQENFPLQLKVSNTFFQNILNLNKPNIHNKPFLQEISAYYALPYHYKPQPQNILIVGSGTGNDVASAIRHGAENIDAVEIDPLIYRFGYDFHPEKPYQNEKVQIFVTDARSFIKSTQKKYDVIVYGLLDSHVLMTGNSNIRLDNYVYTLEGIREARSKLTPDGMIVMAVSLGKGEAVKKIVSKLFRMIEKTFEGRTPIVYKTDYDEGYTFVISNSDQKITPLAGIPFKDITDEVLIRNDVVELSTDNWPFIYMPRKKYPISYIFIISLLIIISYIFTKNTFQDPQYKFSPPCFFLGAGFMFLETKAITELGLIIGNTWMVISAAIISILMMAFLANTLVSKSKGIKTPWAYIGLIFTLVLGFLLSKYGWSNFSPSTAKAFMPLMLSVPLFFSGIVFSSELKAASSISSAMSSNLFGAMVGGFLEYNTMYFGLQLLYIIAIVMYLLGWSTSKLNVNA